MPATPATSADTPTLPEYQAGAAMWRLVDLGEEERRCPQVADARIAADRLLGHLERVLQGRRGLEAELVHGVPLAADDDHVTYVLQRVRRPVPGVEGVDAVVGVGLLVHLPVPGVLGEAGLVLLLDLVRVEGVR